MQSVTNLKYRISRNWGFKKEKIVIDLLEIDENARVLDLGCGSGDLTYKVKKVTGCKEIVGVDGDEQALSEVMKKAIIPINSDLNGKLPFKNNFFDVIITNQVIEHLVYPIKFLKEIYRVLSPNGYAIISTENLASLDNIFALFLGFTPFSMEFDEGLQKIGNPLAPNEKIIKENYLFPHIRIFTLNGLIESCEFTGFKIEQVKGGGHILLGLGELINKKKCRYIAIKLRK